MVLIRVGIIWHGVVVASGMLAMAHYTADDLCIAARKGKVGLVRSILTVVSPNSSDSCGMTAVHWAAQFAHPRLVDLLIAHGSKVNTRGQRFGVTPLHCAASVGCMASVRLLLAAGADPSIATQDGLNSLHYAASLGRFEIASLLYEHGASLHGGHAAEQNPVYRAICKDQGGVFAHLAKR